MIRFPARNILGIPITALSLTEIPEAVSSFIAAPGKKTFFYVNAHALNLASQDSVYREILKKATLVYSGGIGPVLASKFLGEPLIERTPTPDFIDKILFKAQARRWSIYLLGAKEQSLQGAIDILKQRFPKLIIAGVHHGYLSNHEGKKILEDINLLKPKILFVGMGSPKQEKWIAQNLNKADAEVFWAVGALFDVISGKLPRAPFWIRKLYLEWLYRLYQEPKRLWKRYTLGNLEFIYRVFKEKISAR